jgi:hypothetical protein
MVQQARRCLVREAVQRMHPGLGTGGEVACLPEMWPAA